MGWAKNVRVQVNLDPQRVWSVYWKYEEQPRQDSQSEPVSDPYDIFRI